VNFTIRTVLAIVAAICAVAVLLGVDWDHVKLLAVAVLCVAVAVVAP
jgi:hypothetical protein